MDEQACLKTGNLRIFSWKLVYLSSLDRHTYGGKPIRDYYEALGHSEAYDYIYKLAKNGDITEENLKKLHKIFYNRIDEKRAGKYRTEKVFISGSKYSLPGPDKVK